MRLSVFIFLCISLFGSTKVLYGQQSLWLTLADSVVSEQGRTLPNEKKEIPVFKEPNDKEALHFQLDTDKTGKALILIHLKDTIGLLTISAHDLMGNSREVIREHKLNEGFYEFALPKTPSESLKYWQVSMDGQRVISFIK